MSLTKEQWIEMWNAVKSIERSALSLDSRHRFGPPKQIILDEVRIMKQLIQDVIGQQE